MGRFDPRPAFRSKLVIYPIGFESKLILGEKANIALISEILESGLAPLFRVSLQEGGAKPQV